MGVSFHTSLPGTHFVRLMLKKLGKGMPDSLVCEELVSLSIGVQMFMQFRSDSRDEDPAKDHLTTPHFILSVARQTEVLKVRSITELCGLRRWSCMWHQRAHCNASAATVLDTRSVTADTPSAASGVGAPTH